MKIDKNTIVFVSGGAGVIGKELVKKLLNRNCQIYVGDLKPQPVEWIGKILYRQGDLNSLSKDEILSFQPDLFFHLAATFERSTESYEFWDENFHNNILLSHHLMTLLKDLQSLKKVIFASSYLIYNPDLYLSDMYTGKIYKLKETDQVLPRNLTGMAKIAHEIELRFLNNFKNKQFKFASARIFRGYGKGSKDVISRWIRSLLKEEEIKVFRKEGIFDYIYAEDTAEGLIRLAESEKAQGVVNLGSGQACSVKELLNVLYEHFPNLNYEEIEVDVPYEASQADINLLISYTGWKPSHSIHTAIP